MSDHEIPEGADDALRDSITSQSKLAKIVTPEGVQTLIPWLSISKEDIEGEYDFSIVIGSTQPVKREPGETGSPDALSKHPSNPLVQQAENINERSGSVQ